MHTARSADPIAAADIDPLLTFYQSGRKSGDFDAGIENALRALLVSPEFLFRIERAPASAPGGVYRVSDVELASRLSFFLWSSIPDDELLHVAEQGTLRQPVVLRDQVRRMLDDPRAEALVHNFAGQWLQTRSVELARPDADVFRFDEALRQSFMEETTLFVDSIVEEDRSVLNLLDADYTFLNQRLAEHYGVPNVYGSQFRRVTRDRCQSTRAARAGQHSDGHVLSEPHICGAAREVGAREPVGLSTPAAATQYPGLESGTERQGVDYARADASASRQPDVRIVPWADGPDRICARKLRRRGPVARHRRRDRIDATGTLPDGTEFQGPAGLRALLLTKYKDDFVRTATEKLLTYAPGARPRVLRLSDCPRDCPRHGEGRLPDLVADRGGGE